MKITAVRTARVSVPFDQPIRTAIHHIDSVQCLLVWLDTDEGISGESYLFAFNAKRVKVFEAMVASLAELAIGADPHDTQRLWKRMFADINFYGHKGVSIFALSALDWACWDIVGKACGQPVHKLLGACRDRILAYASGGLWLSRDIPALIAEAKGFVAQGFKAVKMRLGKPDFGEDVERAAAVREAIGPNIKLMADANQGLSVNQAIRLGRALEPYRLDWFEEPVQAYDLAGSARVAAELDTPIASGETEYTRYGFQDMLERKAADILMPDLQRVGGVSEFMKVAHMAEALDVPISPHIFTEQSLQLCGAIANCPITEHMPWFGKLFNEPMEMVEGELLIPNRPGMGFTFAADLVQRYRAPN
ncbi:MAG: mandelate racemase/muconate lactonizing enzyme family protein [Gammaproteobacteria bacterium]